MAEKRIKCYKAGQCVTINGKRCRVTKTKYGLPTCDGCAYLNEYGSKYPCWTCLFGTQSILPDDCIFTEIKPKS